MVRFSITGEDGKARTEMDLQFSTPLGMDMKPWTVPTDLIERPTASFSAIRGLDALLSASTVWLDTGLAPTPTQWFVWSFTKEPRFTYCAASVPDASAFISSLCTRIFPNGQGWTNETALAGFKRAMDYQGIEWQGLPFQWPFLRSVVTNDQNYLLGGTFPYTPVVNPITKQFYERALQQEDLVYYGWERTGERVEAWLQLGQFARLVSGAAQLQPYSAGALWLKSIPPKLNDSVTRVFLSSPYQLRLTRSSSLGLTGIELNLLSDWLESPHFPRGLNTFLSTPGLSPREAGEEN